MRVTVLTKIIPLQNRSGGHFRQFNEKWPPPPSIKNVLCNKFMAYHCGVKSYNDIH